MQVPVAVFAIDPRQRSGREPRHEVVALRLVAVPPAALDALRSGEQLETFRLQTPRRGEQPGRARPGRAELVRIPVAGLDATPRVLGAVVRHRGDAVDGFASEARLQALQQLRPVLAFAGCIAEETRAAPGERYEAISLDPDGLHRLAQVEGREAFAQQAYEALDLARRRSEIHGERHGAAARV